MPGTVPTGSSSLATGGGINEDHAAMHGRAAKVWENVLAHGADPTGVSNSATAIQAAITAVATDGGKVYIPPGTYSIGTTLTLPVGVELVGAGPWASQLVHNNGTSALLTMSGAGFAPAASRISDLAFIGGSGTGDAVQLNGTSGANITDVQFTNVLWDQLLGGSATALKCTWALEVIVTRCNFRGIRGTGMKFIDTANACVVRDTIMSNGGVAGTGSAIELYSTNSSYNITGFTLDGSVVEAWRGSYGLKINADTASISNVRITNSHFEDNTGDMLYATSTAPAYATNIDVSGCHFSPHATSTSNIYLKALTGMVRNCDLSTKNLRLETAGGSNNTYYVIDGARFVASAAVTDNTTANQDVVVYTGVRGLASPVGSKFGPSVEILRDRGIMLTESGDPSAPATNNVVIYSRDSGGKTQLVARFPTGAVQQLAIEP